MRSAPEVENTRAFTISGKAASRSRPEVPYGRDAFEQLMIAIRNRLCKAFARFAYEKFASAGSARDREEADF